jgi:cobalamin biosynthesis Mg chelatase CobN
MLLPMDRARSPVRSGRRNVGRTLSALVGMLTLGIGAATAAAAQYPTEVGGVELVGQPGAQGVVGGAGAGAARGAAGTGSLARTGMEVFSLVVLAVVLIAVGFAVWRAARRAPVTDW